MKVFFSAFWGGFDINTKTIDFFTKILSSVFSVPVSRGTTMAECELLVESGFGPSVLTAKTWRASFLFMGESWTRSNWRDYTIILSGQAEADGPNIVPLPLYVLYLYDSAPDGKVPDQVARPMPKMDVVAIISNPAQGVRTRFLDELDRHFNVCYAGRYKNNVFGQLKPAYGTPDFFNFISQFKFVITMENSAQDSYITEKIFHGFFSHNVPVYWGAPRVTDYINTARFLHELDDSPSEFARVVAEMKRLSVDESAWKAIIAQPWEAPGKSRPTIQSIADEIRTRLMICGTTLESPHL